MDPTYVPNPSKADYQDGSVSALATSNIFGWDGDPNGNVTATGPATVLGQGSTEGEMWLKVTLGTSNNQWFKVLANMSTQSDFIQWTPTNIDLLATTGFLMVTDVPGITSITFLHAANTSGYVIKNTAASMTLTFTNLDNITGSTALLTIQNNSGITSISMPVFTDLNANLNTLLIQGNAALTDFSFPSFVPRVQLFNFNDNALSAASVNGILARFVTVVPGWNGILNIVGGTNQGPTGQGLVDLATILESGAFFVFTNVTDLTFTGDNYASGMILDQQPALATVTFTNLTNSNGSMVFKLLPALTDADLSLLATVSGDLQIGDQGSGSPTALTTLDISSLSSVSGSLLFFNASSLTSFTFTALSTTGAISITGCTGFASLSFPALTDAGGGFDLADCTSLVTVSINAPWTPNDGANLNWSNCALNVATVNMVLARCVANPTWGTSGESIDLSGGTNAAPAGQGATDVTTLQGRGATVTTN